MRKKLNKILCAVLSLCLIFESPCFAQVMGEIDITGYLSRLHTQLTTDKFRPLHLRYLSYNDESNTFNLLLDKGDAANLQAAAFEDTSKTLLKYFLIGLSLPNDSFWVNLRPDAQDNIIDEYLGQTDIGRIMLETDLQLKKDTAQFTSPQTPEGKEYWDKLYKKTAELFGTDNVAIPTLTRPWIVPGEIILRETQDSAYIYKANLKVCLEQDYLKGSAVYSFKDPRLKELNEYSSQLIREIIIPKLTKEVNTSRRYAALRQVYYSLIMAQWFKARFRGSGKLYGSLIGRRNLVNLTSKEYWSKTDYFTAYQKSFKDGEYNLKEPVYSSYGQTIRSYFSGGENLQIPLRDFSPGGGVTLIPAQEGPLVVDKEKLVTVTLKIGDGSRISLSETDYKPGSGIAADSSSGANSAVSAERMRQIVQNIRAGLSSVSNALSEISMQNNLSSVAVFSSSPISFIQNKLRRAALATLIFFTFAFPNIANAAKFEFVPNTPHTQVVATIERGDTAWSIAGKAYSGAPNANMQWKNIYESNPQLHNRPNNAMRPMYPDGAYYKDDRHIIVNMRPGDKLAMPGEVNYEAVGLKTPVLSEASVSETIPSTQVITQGLFATQTEQTEHLKAEVQNLETQNKQSQEQVSQLQAQKSNLEKKVEQLNQDKTKLEKGVQDLEQKLSDTKKTLDEAAQKTNPSLKNIVGNLSLPEKTIFSLAGIGILLFGGYLVRKGYKVWRLRRQTEELQRKHDTLQAEVDSLGAQKKDFLKTKEDAEKATLDAQKEAQKLAAQQTELEAERARIRQDADDLEKKRQEIEAQRQGLTDLETQKQSVKDEITSFEADREKVKEDITRAQQQAKDIIRAAEQEAEAIRAQTRLTEASITEEQRRLQGQLDARKAEIQAELDPLEEQLRTQKASLDKTLRLKAEAQGNLEALTAMSSKAQEDLASKRDTVDILKRQQDDLLASLQEIAEQKKSLEFQVEQLQQRLALGAVQQVAELSRQDAIRLKVEELGREVVDLSEQIDSLLDIVGPVDNKKVFSILEQQLRRILASTNFEIQEVPVSQGNSNMIVRIPASKGAEQLPKIILNAHLDIDNSHGYHVYSDIREYKRRKTGALDDRSGVVAVLSALESLRENLFNLNIAHGEIVVIFTDLEEQHGGGFGAADLADKYNNRDGESADLFDNTHILITVDGPLVWGTDGDLHRLNNEERDNPFVVAKLLNISSNDKRSRIVFDSVKAVNFKGFSQPRYPDIDGPGDHRKFAEVTDRKLSRRLPVINIRSPYNDIDPETEKTLVHSPNEKVHIENELVPVAQWLTVIVIGLVKDMNPPAQRNTAVAEFRALPKAMVFDLDNTLSKTTKEITPEMAKKLLVLLRRDIPIAIISAQSAPETVQYLVGPLKDEISKRRLSMRCLSNLYIYPSLGSRGYRCNSSGELISMSEKEYPDYTVGTPFYDEAGRDGLVTILENALKTKLVVVGPVIVRETRPQVPYVHNRLTSFTLGKIHSQAAKDAIQAKLSSIPEFKEKVSVKVGGGGTINIVPRNVDKSFAVTGFKTMLERSGERIENEDILIVGDDFKTPDNFSGGLDRDMVLKGANVYCVGGTEERDLPPGVESYTQGGRSGQDRTLHLLSRYPIPDDTDYSRGGSTVSSPVKIQPLAGPGGIDFRFLPIVSQAVGNLNIRTGSTLQLRLSNAIPDNAWNDIENMLKAGIIPSAERIKEYIQITCLNGNFAIRREEVISCISDILRLEEDCCYAADPELKDILIVLETRTQEQDLKRIFLGTAAAIQISQNISALP